MFTLVLTILIPLLFGFILVFFLWPNQKPFYYDFLIKVNIAIGLGFGIFVSYFFSMVINSRNQTAFFLYSKSYCLYF